MKTDQNLPSRTRISWAQSLPGKLTIIHLLGLLCLLTATVCVVWGIQRPHLLHKQTKNNDLAGSETVSEINQHVTAAESLVRGLAQLAEVLPASAQNYGSATLQLLGNHDSDSSVVGGGIWLEPEFASDVEESYFWARDLQGQLHFQNAISDPNENGYTDEPWYAPARFANPGDIYWSLSYQQPETGRTVVTCATPIFRASQFAGAVTVDLDLDQFQALIAKTSSTSGYAFLLDRNNRFLSYPQPERVRLAVADGKGNWNDEFLTLGQLAKIAPAYRDLATQMDHFDHDLLQQIQANPNYDATIAAGIQETTHHMEDADAIFASALLSKSLKKEGDEPTQRFEMNDPHLSEHCNTAVHQVPGPFWKLLQVSPSAGMVAIVNEHLKHILTWLLLLETGIVLLSLLITRALVGRPIRMIFKRVRELITNNGEGKLDDSPNHELGLVAHQYNRRSNQAARAIDELKRTRTELDKKEEQSAAIIHQCEQQTRSILNASPDAILTLDKAGTIVGANGSAETVFKRESADILGRSLDAFVKIPLNHSIYTFLAQEDRELFGRRLESTGKHLNDEAFAIELTIAEVDADPKIFVAYVRDITDRRIAREELVQKRELAQDAARSKDAFLARMSHELRTPLNVILGFTEAMHEGIYGPVNRQQSNTLNRVRDRGTDLLRLIDDILDVAEIGAGELKLQYGPVQIPDLCAGSISKVQKLATKKEILIQQHIDSRVATILADQRRMQQVLTNLLSNAVKFTPVGGKVTLEVKGNPSEDTVDFTIKDTGIGISAEDMNVLFEPFVQVDGGLTRQYPGTGIGLCIVYHLAEMHGGRVSASSELQRGSAFTVTIPWKLPQPTLLAPQPNVGAGEERTFLAPFPPTRSVQKGKSSEGSKPRTDLTKGAASILPSKQHIRPEDIAKMAGLVKAKEKSPLPATSIASDPDVRNLLAN